MPPRNTLLHRLLILIYRWALGSSSRVLHLITHLNRWLKSLRIVTTASSAEKASVWPFPYASCIQSDTQVQLTGQQIIPANAGERSVITSCSSLPSTPPALHIHEGIGKTEFIPARSPTPTDNLGFLSDIVCKDGHKLPGFLSSLNRQSLQFNPRLTSQTITAEIAHVGLNPTLPSRRPRYDREIVIGNNTGPWDFRPLETLTVSEQDVMGRRTRNCSPWLPYVHPEGQPYYCFKDDPYHFCYLTEADASSPIVRMKLERFIFAIEQRVASLESAQLSKSIEVVLEVGDAEEWMYYMADMDRRCIFWLDEYDLSSELCPRFGVESKDQFQNILAYQFWLHIEHFPITYRQPMDGLFSEVLETLAYLNIDGMTSMDSCSSLEATEFLSLVNTIKDLRKRKDWTSSSYVIVSLARVMCIIMNERTFNFHGFHGARLSISQSVRGKAQDQWTHSILIKCLSPLLFYAPTNYLWRLERLLVDGILREKYWQAFQDRLNSDLSGTLVLSAVLLVVNAVLLSRSKATGWPAPATVANQLSAISSLGAITIGLQLKAQELRVDAKGFKRPMACVLTYLGKSRHAQLNLESLAIHFSLPYAMLIWSVVTLLVSIAILCFDVAGGSISLVSQIICAVFWSFMLSLVLWSIVTSWQYSTDCNFGRSTETEQEVQLHEKKATPKKMEIVTSTDLSLAEKASPY